jgi:predicted AAA+ superfamily ATPase
VDVTVSTAKHWLSILTASFQVYLLQPYHSNITKRLVKTPKLYFLDTGLCAYLTEWSSHQTLASGAMSGAIFETHVFGEILKSWWNRIQMPQCYYYRDKDGKEIDFLFVKDQTLYPVEVKLGATPKRDWVKHFKLLGKFKPHRGDGAVVCLCRQQLPLTSTTTAVPAGVL